MDPEVINLVDDDDDGKDQERQGADHHRQQLNKKRKNEEDEGDICDMTRRISQNKERKIQGRYSSFTDLISKYTPPLYLLRLRGIPEWANTGILGLSFSEAIPDESLYAIVSSYYIDVEWLLEAVPSLKSAGHLLFVHGHHGQAALMLKEELASSNLLKKCTVHAPRLPPYGTHHSKFFIIQYKRGLRVIIHTANLISIDCNNKTQGAYMQDFPVKDNDSPATSTFEDDLKAYFENLHLPLSTLRQVHEILSLHDFSCSRTKLIASVPGSHTNRNFSKWGHLKLRSILEQDASISQFVDSRIAINYSSTGSFNEKWLREFHESLTAGINSKKSQENKETLGDFAEFDDFDIIWPTVDNVRNSLEGWSAGGSILGKPDKIQQPFLRKLFCPWEAENTGRQRAMPHIKSYVQYIPADMVGEPSRGPASDYSSTVACNQLAYVCFSSHNLSKAAWGQQQKHRFQGKQLRILAYELGVILTPETELNYLNSRWYGFSITDSGTPSSPSRLKEGTRVCLLQWQPNQPKHPVPNEHNNTIFIPIPIPYQLPPKRYPTGEDAIPWDSRPEGFPGLDVYGCQM